MPAAKAVDALVRQLTAGVVDPRVLMVGHSMGGRVALEAQRRMLDVDLRVITLGSPLQGTWATRVPLSGWFLGATAPLTPMTSADPPRVTCYYTRLDHMVRPASAWVRGALCVDVGVATHWSLPTCVLVKDCVRRYCHDWK